MLINSALRAFRVVQIGFKATLLQVGLIIELKYFFQFLSMNEKEAFRPILIPIKTNLFYLPIFKNENV